MVGSIRGGRPGAWLGRVWAWLLVLWIPSEVAAQAVLVPSNRSPYSTKFDLQVPDAQYLFLPQTPVDSAVGPYRFRFLHPALNELLAHPATVSYVLPREGGYQLQVLNLRPAELPADALGPQEFEIESGAGEVIGRGRIVVVNRPPEAVDLVGADMSRVFEAGRPARVRLVLRTNQNFSGELRAVNTRDFELTVLGPDSAAAPGMAVLEGVLRPLRPGVSELRVLAGTADGRFVELAFGGLTVREPEPHRVGVRGGPIYLDALDRGSAQVVIYGFEDALTAAPVVVAEPGGELAVVGQEFDPAKRELRVWLEFAARSRRPAGSRELRELVVRSGARVYRGTIEVVGAPVVSGVQVGAGNRAVLTIGGEPELIRVTGQNLDELRVDCSPLGDGAVCEHLGSGPTELVARVAPGLDAPEGEVVLPLVATGGRAAKAGANGARITVRVERPSIPLLLTQPGLLELNCAALRSCRRWASGEAVTVNPADALRLQLLLDTEQIPAEHGWQRLTITVIRVRGEQRQPVRVFGTQATPRTYRRGLPAGALSLIDASADPRHGDQFIVRVEHAAEQYAPEYRSSVEASEAFIRQIYVDGGRSKRLTGDIAVQPVLFSFGRSGDAVKATPMYPNAGLGLTWHFLNERLEPRAFSAKLQLLATNIKEMASGGNSMQPALFLSANLRIPGTDPTKPLVLTSGIARLWGEDGGWRILAGAGMDLGVARLIFGG